MNRLKREIRLCVGPGESDKEIAYRAYLWIHQRHQDTALFPSERRSDLFRAAAAATTNRFAHIRRAMVKLCHLRAAQPIRPAVTNPIRAQAQQIAAECDKPFPQTFTDAVSLCIWEQLQTAKMTAAGGRRQLMHATPLP